MWIYLFFLGTLFLGLFFLGYWYTKQKMVSTFQSLSYDLMEKNNKLFLDLATSNFERYQESAKGELQKETHAIEKNLLPIKETLERLERQNSDIERQRISSYSSLTKQVSNLIESEHLLRAETANLVKALKSPNIRGAWGQVHLKRVVELSGMLQHCDFFEQKTEQVQEKTYRPDVLVKLPGNRNIIIDAKTPVDAYLESVEASDEECRKKMLKKHAKHLKQHMKDLSSKEYWKCFSPSPEYVVLFLPAEAFFSAALQEEPALLEIGAKRNIIIATPTTLIAILRAIAYSWSQAALSENAKEIASLGSELYDRMQVMNQHWSRLGKSLNLSVDAYNQAMASFESRVLVSAKRLKELGISKGKDHFVERISKKTNATK